MSAPDKSGGFGLIAMGFAAVFLGCVFLVYSMPDTEASTYFVDEGNAEVEPAPTLTAAVWEEPAPAPNKERPLAPTPEPRELTEPIAAPTPEPPPAPPQDPNRGYLIGRVIDSATRAPIPNATIRLYNPRRTLTTDRYGEFTADLPPGRHHVHLEAENYLKYEGMHAFTAGAQTNATIEMTHLSETDGADFEYGGIGARLARRGENVIFHSLMPDSPAERSGLQAGDVIVTVDNAPLSKQTTTSAMAQIRGAADQPVLVEVLRDGVPLRYEIVRERIQMGP